METQEKWVFGWENVIYEQYELNAKLMNNQEVEELEKLEAYRYNQILIN